MPQPTHTGVVTPWRARTILLGVAVVGVVLDQVAKQAAVAALVPERPVPLVGRLLQLYLIRNSGAAFSLGEGATWVFALLASLVLVGLLVVVLPRVRHWGWAVAFGLLGAGVAGNLVDRVVRPPAAFRGHVVDFLMLPHWPIFNVADMMIVAAAAVIIALSFFGHRGPTGRAYDRDDAKVTA
ncbi:signal peptidase II [Raineyella sp. LH-20]|uniref:signal peptidase II n=1 Tax=Raineyella sp. LH-20 TaxID=3081204 RepID=UPI002953BFEB|nr:signal peptidase II [Raineyella sp. LH-20]WOP17658.1 signal peptidase II [Raineyella sp. LH-20]